MRESAVAASRWVGRAGHRALAEHLATANRLEGGANMFNVGRAAIVGPDNGDHIEPARLFEQAVELLKLEGGSERSLKTSLIKWLKIRVLKIESKLLGKV